jgi:hypothetical protein
MAERDDVPEDLTPESFRGSIFRGPLMRSHESAISAQ